MLRTLFILIFSCIALMAEVNFRELRKKVSDYELGAGLPHNLMVKARQGLGIVGSFEFPQVCNKTEIMALRPLFCADGSFTDIDYKSRSRSDWLPLNHLLRLKQLAVAVRSLDLSNEEQMLFRQHYLKGIDFWLKAKASSSNWWNNEIGMPKVLGSLACLIFDELTDNQKVGIISQLKKSRIGRTGQNRLWLSMNVAFRAIIEEDEKLLQSAFQGAKQTVSQSTKEGIQFDNSFQQHGPQLYQGNYGRHYAQGVAFYLYLTQNSVFQLSDKEVDIIVNFLLDGTRWMVWNDLLDYNTWGRQVSYDDRVQGPDLLLTLKSLANQKVPRTVEFNQWVDAIISKENHLIGNKHFWNSDFMVQRNVDFYTSTRMNSKRTLGNEVCNGEGLLNYYLADGATLIYRTGDEYKDIFPVWDWNQISGVTALKDYRPKKWLPYRGKTSFVGGVSSGKVGVATMDYNRFGLSLKKSYFNFEDILVVLGSDIKTPIGKNAFTSVNQVIANGKIEQLTENKWHGCRHDGISYFFPKATKFSASVKTQTGNWKRIKNSLSNNVVEKEVFSVGINHKIKQFSYAISTKRKVPTDLNILCNNGLVHAVKCGKITMVSFFSQGEFKSKEFEIRVSEPCAVIVTATSISVADPSQKLKALSIEIDNRLIEINLPKGGFAGSSITFER